MGQTIVEFALVVALLLAILFGIVEFGRAWFYSNHLNNSVRAAARFASVLGSTSGGFQVGTIGDLTKPPTTVMGYLTLELTLANMDAANINTDPNKTFVKVTAPDGTPVSGTPNRGDTIKVTITYNFHVLTGSIIPSFNGNIPLTRSASMRYEG